MAVWSTISSAEIEYSRIDADFYHPIYQNELKLWHRLDECVGVKKLEQIITTPVRTGRTPKARLIKNNEECIPFIKTDTVREGSIDFDNSAQLPLRVIGKQDIIPNDAVVLTIIGATPEIVGRAAIVRANDPECVTNQNVAVISTNNSFDPYFLTAYFQTKYGRDQVWRHSRRTEQVNLNCREIERILVPNPAAIYQEAIGDLVRNSFASADHSIELYKKAQQLFDTELKFDTLVFKKCVGYKAQLSEVTSNDRFDSEYFQPQYDVVRSLVKAYPNGYEPLLVCCDSLKANIDPSKHPKQVYNYIELSNINSSIGTVEGFLTDNGKKMPSRAKRQVNVGDVIASSVVGSVEKAAIIADEQNGFIASTGFFHLRPLTVSSEYLLLLVRSQCVRMQFIQQATGGILSAVSDNRLKHVIIPKLPEGIQAEITDLVKRSHVAKNEADRLLNQAKSRVEQLIEEAIKS